MGKTNEKSQTPSPFWPPDRHLNEEEKALIKEWQAMLELLSVDQATLVTALEIITEIFHDNDGSVSVEPVQDVIFDYLKNVQLLDIVQFDGDINVAAGVLKKANGLDGKFLKQLVSLLHSTHDQ